MPFFPKAAISIIPGKGAALAGLLTYSTSLRPSRPPVTRFLWQWLMQVAKRHYSGAYSIGKCPGFSPGSLLSSPIGVSTYAGANVGKLTNTEQYFVYTPNFAAYIHMAHHPHIINNKREFRFEAQLPDGTLATLSYRWQKANMLLMQLTAPPAAKEATDALIEHVLEYARHHHLKIVVYAPAVAAYMREHERYDDLLHK